MKTKLVSVAVVLIAFAMAAPAFAELRWPGGCQAGLQVRRPPRQPLARR